MRKGWMVVLILLVVIVGGRYIYGAINKPSDDVLIRQALQEALKASREGRPGNVLELISSRFSVNSEQPGSRQIADLVRKMRPNVELANSTPVINGDTAEINSDVTISSSLFGQSIHVKDVKLTFKKEGAMEWLIFPSTKWQLTNAETSDLDAFGQFAR